MNEEKPQNSLWRTIAEELKHHDIAWTEIWKTKTNRVRWRNVVWF